MLPDEAQRFINHEHDNIVASAATIHIINKLKDKEPEVVTSRRYDFSNSKEIRKFYEDKRMLDEEPNKARKIFGIFQPSSEDNHGGYIITGINVSRITGSYKNHFQLHGYWDWQTQMLVSKYDKLGLGWTNGFSSHEISQNAYGNRHYDGKSIKLKKLPYNHKERFNRGVIWTHASAYSSEGAALAQIYDNSLSDQEIGVWFEYVATQGPTSDDGWGVNIEDTILTYFGIPKPGAYYYDSFEKVHCPK